MLTSPRTRPSARGWRALAAILAVAVTVLSPTLAAPRIARADDVAEAAVLFARGNEHFQRAMRLRGDRRQRELEAALAQYFDSLARVRSRNVIYNTALVLEALGRPDEAFNHWTEYLAVTGLSDEEAADGRQHRDALVPLVAVYEVHASVEAEVWIDRRDLGSRGRTPLTIALAAGDHTFFLAAAGHREAQTSARGSVGQTTQVSMTLEMQPVWLQVLAPEGTILEIDGGRVMPGQSVPVQPGPHLARVSTGDRVLGERRFEIMPGSAPMVIDMSSALGAGGLEGGVVEVAVNVAAQIEIDGIVQGEGDEVAATLSPGPHRVRVTASGRRAFEGSPEFTTFPARLEVRLAPGTNGWIYAGRGIFGGLASLSVVAAAITAPFAVALIDSAPVYTSEQEAAGHRATMAAMDITLALSAGLGGLAILFLALDPGGGESTATFAVTPTMGGAALTLQGALGGAP